MPKATKKQQKRKALTTPSSVCNLDDAPDGRRQASLVKFFGQPIKKRSFHQSKAPMQPESSSTLIGCTNEDSSSRQPQATTRKKKTGPPKKTQQLYLDFGQASFGKRTQCPHCGTLYVDGVEEDRVAHDRVCRDFVHGVPLRITPALRASKDVIPLEADVLVIEVRMNNTAILRIRCRCFDGIRRPSLSSLPMALPFLQVKPSHSLSLRRKAQEVQKIAEQELGFASSDSSSENWEKQAGGTGLSNFTYFLHVVHQRVVGLLATESITRAFVAMGNESVVVCSGKASKANLGVHLLWVHKKHRGKRIATRLLDLARERTVYGYTMVPFNRVAFSSPTEAGLGFARSYMRGSGQPVLVYQYANAAAAAI